MTMTLRFFKYDYAQGEQKVAKTDNGYKHIVRINYGGDITEKEFNSECEADAYYEEQRDKMEHLEDLIAIV